MRKNTRKAWKSRKVTVADNILKGHKDDTMTEGVGGTVGSCDVDGSCG